MKSTETLAACIGCKMIDPEQFISALDNYIAERFKLSPREVASGQLAAARAEERRLCVDAIRECGMGNLSPYEVKIQCLAAIDALPALPEPMPVDAPHVSVNFHMARGIPEDHWLSDGSYPRFLAAYGYASNQTRAIDALSAIDAGHVYWLVRIIMARFGLWPDGCPDIPKPTASALDQIVQEPTASEIEN